MTVKAGQFPHKGRKDLRQEKDTENRKMSTENTIDRTCDKHDGEENGK